MKKRTISLLYGVAVLLVVLASCKKDNQTPVVKPPPNPIYVTITAKIDNPLPGDAVSPTDTSVLKGSSATFVFNGIHRVKSIDYGAGAKFIYGSTVYTVPSINTNLNATVVYSDTLTKAAYDLKTSYLKGFWVDRVDSSRFTGSHLQWQPQPMDPSDVGVYFGTKDGIYTEYNGPTPKSPGVPGALRYTGTALLSYDGKHVTTTVGGVSSTVEVVELTAKSYVFIITNYRGSGLDYLCHATLK